MKGKRRCSGRKISRMANLQRIPLETERVIKGAAENKEKEDKKEMKRNRTGINQQVRG